MPLSWNEIKSRAIAFAKEWSDAADERAQAQPFWIEFFAVFGLSPKRIASFEHAVKKHGGGLGSRRVCLQSTWVRCVRLAQRPQDVNASDRQIRE